MNRKRQPDSEPALNDEAQKGALEPRSNRRSVTDALQRVGLACFGVLGTVGLLMLAACPANLENPDQVIVAPAVAGSGSGGAPFVDTVDLTCVTAAFKRTCTQPGCHSASSPAAHLDLATPGFAGRMVDVTATNELAGGACTPSKLIDSANPGMSWLLAKIMGTQGTCGSLMPVIGTLSSDEKTCITTFVNAEAKEHMSAGTAGPTAAGSSSGGSGAASAGSGGM